MRRSSVRESDVGREDDVSDAVTVTATWGRETLQVAKYTSIEVGPFSVTTNVRPNETAEQALERAYRQCETMARSTIERKLAQHRESVARAAARISR